MNNLLTQNVRDHLHDALDLMSKIGGTVAVEWDGFAARYAGGSVEVSHSTNHVATFATLGDLLS